MPNIIKQIVTNKPNTIKMIVKSSERGAQGVQGIPGTAATIEAGQAYSVSPDSEPSVQNVGSSSAAVFDFYIPKGEQGEPGAPGVNGKDGVDGAVQYTAGAGIEITEENVINATGGAVATWGDINGTLADQTDLQNALNAKQGTLTAGTNISITDNVISASGGEYTAGNGLDLTGKEFSVDTTTIATKSDIKNATLTIKHDGTSIATFTANSATDTEANIVSPVQIGSTLSPTNPVAYVGTSNIVNGAVTLAKIDTPSLVDFFYPVGTYYETSDTSFNPNTAWGGTWVEDSAGMVTVAKNTGTFSTVGASGGEESHTLSISEIPKHNHPLQIALLGSGGGVNSIYGTTFSSTANGSVITTTTAATSGEIRWGVKDNTSGDGAHNNLQPYIVVKRWHRTA